MPVDHHRAGQFAVAGFLVAQAQPESCDARAFGDRDQSRALVVQLGIRAFADTLSAAFEVRSSFRLLILHPIRLW